MISTTRPHADPIAAFIESTQRLSGLLDTDDVTTLGSEIQRQLEAFEALVSAIETNNPRDITGLKEAIEAGRKANAYAANRMRGIRDELDGLRAARARTARKRQSRATAQFISQRV